MFCEPGVTGNRPVYAAAFADAARNSLICREEPKGIVLAAAPM